MKNNAGQDLISLCNQLASELDTTSMDLYLATHEGHTIKEVKKILLYNIQYLEKVERQIKQQLTSME